MQNFRDILTRVLTTRVAWPILICVGLLCAISLSALDIASQERFAKQQVWLGLGAIVILVSILPPYQMLGVFSYAMYGVTLVLLVAVLFAPEVANTHRWFVFPGGVQLQPSELAKIAYVLALAWYLRYRQDLHTLRGLVVPFAMTVVPFFLILIEPDLGTAMLFPAVLYAMLLAAGAKMRHLLAIAIIALAAMPGAYPFLKPYQQARIKSQILILRDKEDEAHRNGPGWQAFVSRVVIGAGGATGAQDTAADKDVRTAPIRLGLLPEAYTDFIFSVVGLEYGFLGCLLILLFYAGFFGAAIEIASTSRDLFGRLLAVGLACTIIFQALLNISMTISLMPVVGVSLPFVSYGGSSLLVSFLAVGLLINISVRRFPRRA